MSALRPLRPHQERALVSLRASLASGKRRPLLQAPCGFGKTKLAAEIIRSALNKGRRVAFTVPAVSLIDQTVSSFDAEGIDCIGVMQGIHQRTDRSQPVQVCSVQTVARRKRPDVDLVIADEAHRMDKEIFRWMNDAPEVPFIGLSATPWARGLGRYYDDLIIAATTADLIRDGFLAPFVVFAPSEPDLAGVSTVAGDFNEAELADAMDRPKIVGDTVETWLKLGERRPTLVYGVNRSHAQHIAECFGAAGVSAEYMDAFTDRPDRELIFDRLRAGSTKVICNVGVLTTGVDLPMVSCIVDAKPTKSRMLFVQTIGRGLRTAEGKKDCRILDHAGNHLRLGMVTDIGQDHLDDGDLEKRAIRRKSEDKEPKPKLCEGCKAVVPIAARVCSHCGAPVHAKTDVQAVDGELIELGARRSGAKGPSPVEKEDFYRELKWIQRNNGHMSGWCWHKYQERFKGERPPKWFETLAPREPSISTKNWIFSRQIAFSKARGRVAHG